MAPLVISSVALIFVVVLRAEKGLTVVCLEPESDDQIQRYLTSSKPPYDNYYNISRAVYPSVDLPSLLIKITVTFLVSSDVGQRSTANMNNNSKVNESGSWQTANLTRKYTWSTANMNNNSKVNESGSWQTANLTRKYTWSTSCLYVSGGPVSLFAMNVFSLWAIVPNKRERQLQITLPQFCKGSPDEAPQNNTMMYFLSTLQDIAVGPTLHDPRLNTAECVITGHNKASKFSGLKQLLHGVCWSLLITSLVMSSFVSQWLMGQLRDNWSQLGGMNNDPASESKTFAVMILFIIVFIVGISLNVYALPKISNIEQDVYVVVFFVFVILVILRRVIFCICTSRNRKFKEYVREFKFCKCLTSGHETGANIVSCLIVYPAAFMVCHHVLWIFLGIITDPFWGITVFVAVTSPAAALYILVCEFHKSSSILKGCDFCMSLFLLLAILFTFVLLIMVLLVVARVFLSEDLVFVVVQNVLVLVTTVWFKYLKLGAGGGGGGGGRGGGGGGAGGGGGGGVVEEEEEEEEEEISL